MSQQTRRLGYIAVSLISLFNGASAQITGGGVGNLDVGGSLVDFVDALVFHEIETLPQLATFLGVVVLLYAIELNLFEQSFKTIDHAIEKAVGDAIGFTPRTRRGDDGGYPTGTRLMALAVAFVTANGVFFLLPYWLALAFAALGLLAVLLGHVAPFRGDDEEDGSSSSSGSGGSDGSGSSGGDGSGSGAAYSLGDYVDSFSDAIDDVSDTVDTLEDLGSEERMQEAVTLFDWQESFSDTLREVNDLDNWRQLRRSMGVMNTEYEDQSKNAHHELKSIDDRSEILLEDLEEALQKAQNDQAAGYDTFDDGSELYNYLKSQQGQFLEGLEKINQQFERMLAEEEEYISHLRDELDADLKLILKYWKVKKFFEVLPIDIKSVRMDSDRRDEVRRALAAAGVQGINQFDFWQEVSRFHDQEDTIKENIAPIEEVLREEMKLQEKEKRVVEQIFDEKLGSDTDIRVRIDGLEQALEWYNNDPNGFRDKWLNQVVPAMRQLRKNITTTYRQIDSEGRRGGKYEARLYQKIDDILENKI